MRKSIIYCIVVVLLIGLVPEKVNAAEPEVYEITIYPNKSNNNTYNLNSLNDQKLKLKNVDVDYNVNEQDNTIDINFSDDIFIDRIISTGNTIHNNIICDNDYILDVNQNLDTDVVVGSRTNNISISYEYIKEVDSITIQSADYDFSGGLLDGEIFLRKDNLGNRFLTNACTDNDIDTSVTLLGSTTRLSYTFDSTVDIKSMRYYVSGSLYCMYINFYDVNNHLIYKCDVYKTGYVDVDLSLSDVKRIVIDGSFQHRVYLHEFNVYEYILSEVLDLKYDIEGNNVVLTWTNPESIDGVNIYRNGEYITTTTAESFSENLKVGTYEYKITTFKDGKESSGINIQISIQSAPPTTVKNIRMINMTSTGGLIMWDENPVFENVEKYIIYVNGEKHGEIEAPPYPLEGLEEGKTYNIGVTAINSYGESQPPATITFTPTQLAELKNSINIVDIFDYISMLFRNLWPLLALAIAIIISPKIYNLIKTNVT